MGLCQISSAYLAVEYMYTHTPPHTNTHTYTPHTHVQVKRLAISGPPIMLETLLAACFGAGYQILSGGGPLYWLECVESSVPRFSLPLVRPLHGLWSLVFSGEHWMEILESERLIFQTYVQCMKQLCVADLRCYNYLLDMWRYQSGLGLCTGRGNKRNRTTTGKECTC